MLCQTSYHGPRTGCLFRQNPLPACGNKRSNRPTVCEWPARRAGSVRFLAKSASIDDLLSVIKQGFEAQTKRLDSVEKHLGERLDSVEQHLDNVEQHLGKQTKHVTSVKQQLGQVVNELGKLTELQTRAGAARMLGPEYCRQMLA